LYVLQKQIEDAVR